MKIHGGNMKHLDFVLRYKQNINIHDMKKLTNILIILVLLCSIESFGQGQISRPAKPQTQTSKPQKTASQVKISDPDGFINGHGYVDLGLPSGTKWATCNVGATMTNDYGGYYTWGEVTPKSKYTKDNSLNGDKNLGNIAGIPKYDAATYNWGNNWQIPNREHFDELKSQCKWSVITYKGIKGHKVIGPNGKSLFLPCGGCKQNANDPYLGEGNYLTSDRDGYGPIWFNIFGSGSGRQGYGDIDYYAGRSIRAVVR